jgi:acyl carrier protein
MNIETKLRELLIPVFGVDTAEEIQPQHSLVKDLGATSIDFVEISYIIESNFGVIIKTNEFMVAGTSTNPDELFIEGVLTAEGAALLNKNMGKERFKEGQTKRNLFESITVADLAEIIESKMSKKD